MPIESATLPIGWEGRTRRIQNAGTRQNTGWCIEAHDLAASKLVAYRDKDRDFVRVLLAEGLIKAWKLRLRIGLLPSKPDDPDLHQRLLTWLEVTWRELSVGDAGEPV